jgi:hypothetical protein
MSIQEYKAHLNRNVLDADKIIRLARTVETLVIMGRSLKAALIDVKSSFGLSKEDLVEVVRLLTIVKE